jgi:Fe2+ transport system protein B
VVLHPVFGLLLLAVVMFLMFQAVFAWAAPLMGLDRGRRRLAGRWGALCCRQGPLRSLLVDGVIAGVGGVLVFLPQILILFAFILALEDRATCRARPSCWTADGRSVGLSGRSFIPLLSSFACAIPGIMATRSIPTRATAGHHPDRAADDLLGAPAGVCAADRRLHPAREVWACSTCRAWCCSRCTWPASLSALLVAG